MSLFRKDLILKAFLGLPSDILREHVRLSRVVWRCWVCGQRLTRRRSAFYQSGACFGAFGPLWAVPGRAWGTLKRLRRAANGDAIMGWKEAQEDAAKRGGLLILKKDKQKALFVAVSEPGIEEIEGFKKGSTRVVYPVATLTLPVGTDSSVQMLRLGSKGLGNYGAQVGQGQEAAVVVEVTRHGKPKSMDTVYSFRIVRKLKPAEKKIALTILKNLEAVPE